MTKYSDTQPGAQCYEMLLRAALHYQSMAGEIYNESIGCVDDFRIIALLREIATRYQGGEKETVPDELIESAQGSDLRPWLFGINWHLPGGALECRVYWQDAIRRLQKDKLQRLIDATAAEADKALKQGHEKRYAELLTDAQNLRRKMKRIMF